MEWCGLIYVSWFLVFFLHNKVVGFVSCYLVIGVSLGSKVMVGGNGLEPNASGGLPAGLRVMQVL
jgi:hypothetical protein